MTEGHSSSYHAVEEVWGRVFHPPAVLSQAELLAATVEERHERWRLFSWAQESSEQRT